MTTFPPRQLTRRTCAATAVFHRSCPHSVPRRWHRLGRVIGRGHSGILSAAEAWPARGKRSEEHTSELQSQMRISYAVFCLKTKKAKDRQTENTKARTNT